MPANYSHLPTVERYLARLPSGLKSYPECQVKTDFIVVSQRNYGHLLDRPEVPAELRAAVDMRKKALLWHPVVHLVAHQCMVCDLAFAGDGQAYLQSAEARCMDIFRGPLYRALFFVMSPNLLVMGTAKRWAMFTRGIDLTLVGGQKQQHEGRLTYPPHLFDAFACELLGLTLRCAMAAAGAKELTFEAQTVSPAETRLLMRWRA